MLFSSRVRVMVRIRFSHWLVSGYAHVSVLLSVVAVALPQRYGLISSAFDDWAAAERQKPERYKQTSKHLARERINLCSAAGRPPNSVCVIFGPDRFTTTTPMTPQPDGRALQRSHVCSMTAAHNSSSYFAI